MKHQLYLVVAIISLFSLFILSGCASVSIRDNLVTGPVISSDKQMQRSEKAVSDDNVSTPYPKLEAAYWQITVGDTHKVNKFNSISKLAKYHNPLPDSFAKNPMISKMIVSTRDALLSGKIQSFSISRGDIKKFVRMIDVNFGINHLNPTRTMNEQLAEDLKKPIYRIVLWYLYDYFIEEDGFVDRDGTKYSAPEYKGKIENSTITAIVGILWEAIADELLETPVWYKKDKVTKKDVYLTKDNVQPTASKRNVATDELVVTLGKVGIEENEVKVMRFLSGLAGEQSKILSGSVYRAIGKVNIGFVAESGFSFGDNETLAKILDTSFEVLSKRIVLELSRQVFKDVSVNISSDDPIKASAIELLKILQ